MLGTAVILAAATQSNTNEDAAIGEIPCKKVLA